MPSPRPKLPVKKTNEEMALYLKYGSVFGILLLSMRSFIQTGYIGDLEDIFKENAKNLFKPNKDIESITFPFVWQKNYLDVKFGKAICLSKNNIIAHGKVETLETGDIVSVDCGLLVCFKNGSSLHFDSAFTEVFGGTEEKDRWIYSSAIALQEIANEQPKSTKEISTIIRKVAKSAKLKQIVSLTGHGIGYALHEPPAIHNAPGDFSDVNLFDGLVFCAEPIFVKPNETIGLFNSEFITQTVLGSNGWEVLASSDESSSHFETMFGIINGQIVDLIGMTEWEF